MQQEDDLRALAKIMEFGRAVSIFLLVVHVYVYCYPSIASWNLNLEVIDKIIMNFNNTTGSSIASYGANWQLSCCWPSRVWEQKVSRARRSPGTKSMQHSSQDASFSFPTGGYWICPCPMRLSPHFMYSHWCPAIFAC